MKGQVAYHTVAMEKWNDMDKMPSDNIDNLLLALSKMEYRDFIGINLKLAESLIKVMETMKAMLEYEIKVRDVEVFAPQGKQSHKQDNGSYM